MKKKKYSFFKCHCQKINRRTYKDGVNHANSSFLLERRRKCMNLGANLHSEQPVSSISCSNNSFPALFGLNNPFEGHAHLLNTLANYNNLDYQMTAKEV